MKSPLSLPYVRVRKAKGREYVYFERDGVRERLPHPDDGVKAFHAAYNAALRGAGPMPGGRTVKALAASYVRSDRWKELKPRTQEDYAKVISDIEAALGPTAISAIERRHVIRMRDAFAEAKGVRRGNYCAQVFRTMCEHGIDIGWIKANPAKGVSLLKTRPGTEKVNRPWTAEEQAEFEAVATPRARIIYELCLGTGQRIGDVLLMKWSDLKDGSIHVVQEKTGAKLWIPLTDRLRDYLARDVVRHEYIVPGGWRTPLARHSANYAMRQASPPGCTIHGLRYTAVYELAMAGCSDEEIASITGHASLAMVRKYAGEARQLMRAKAAQEKRR